VDRSHDQPKLTISTRNASQVRIDLGALGVKLTETQLGVGATVEDAVLTLLPPTLGADIGLSTPVAPVR
jgi:monoamine oxidase